MAAGLQEREKEKEEKNEGLGLPGPGPWGLGLGLGLGERKMLLTYTNSENLFYKFYAFFCVLRFARNLM